MQTKLNKMRHAREVYDEIIRKELETPSEKPKKIKMVEPPIVTPETVVDVSAEFNQQIEKEYEQYILLFHPDVLNVKDNEVM